MYFDVLLTFCFVTLTLLPFEVRTWYVLVHRHGGQILFSTNSFLLFLKQAKQVRVCD